MLYLCLRLNDSFVENSGFSRTWKLTRNLLKPGLSNSPGALSFRIYQTLHSPPNPACAHRAGSSLSGVRRSRIPGAPAWRSAAFRRSAAVDSNLWSQEPDTADPIPVRRHRFTSPQFLRRSWRSQQYSEFLKTRSRWCPLIPLCAGARPREVNDLGISLASLRPDGEAMGGSPSGLFRIGWRSNWRRTSPELFETMSHEPGDRVNSSRS